MTATVAIMGRPNVGKSTLFNRLVGRKIALVDDQPGVTRDRREGEAKLGDLRFKVFDTAGLDDIRGESLEARMSAQAEPAVEQADVGLVELGERAVDALTEQHVGGRVDGDDAEPRGLQVRGHGVRGLPGITAQPHHGDGVRGGEGAFGKVSHTTDNSAGRAGIPAFCTGASRVAHRR